MTAATRELLMGASAEDDPSASDGASDNVALLPCPIDARSRRRLVGCYFNGRRGRREKWEGVNASYFNVVYF
jgi:hypothetical protein